MICPFQTSVLSGIRPSGPQMEMLPALQPTVFLDPCLGSCLLPVNEPEVQDEVNEEARNGKLNS